MARLTTAVWYLLAFASAAAAQPPAVRIETADAQIVTGTITYDIRCTNGIVAKWTAFLPEPPELASQTKVKTTVEPAGKVVVEKGPLARKLRIIEVPVAKPTTVGKLLLRQEIQATLRTRKLVPLGADEKPPAVTPLTAAERKAYLASAPRIDFEKESFKDWLVAKKLRRGKIESTIDYATRLLTTIRTDFAYKFDTTQDRRASKLCTQGATDCGGMSFLFVAAMRANDIPARVLVGRFAQSRKPGTRPIDTEYDQPHVRAEFHVAGVGWVPVDPANANRDRNLPAAEFIGRDLGDLIVLHVDLDLRLPTPGGEKVIDVMQIEPFIWVTGKGNAEIALAGSTWDVRAVPVDKK